MRPDIQRALRYLQTAEKQANDCAANTVKFRLEELVWWEGDMRDRVNRKNAVLEE